MIRNPKALGLALMAVLAIGAVTASGAMAQEQGVFTVEGGGTALLEATQTGKGTNYLELFGEQVECPGSSVLGEAEHGATTGTVSLIIEQLENNCRTSAGFFVTTNMEGCTFLIHLGKTSPPGNEEGKYSTEAELECPEGKTVLMQVFLDSNHTISLCKMTMPPQPSVGGVRVVNTEGEGDLDIEGAAEGIEVVRHASPCGEEATGEATLYLDVTVTAWNEEEEPVAVVVSE